ncbi:hypothetical protein SeMB42_g03271 [Synchytrium endobioticum]|uniref:Uncharacterized protein n=1 Tax=Synchytrium endobioticum TaxID=286115 RepID=A0A507D815_9FUNG|nr:hypothetical protein SeMB42_g03271 [Synchytrium endobioticum]
MQYAILCRSLPLIVSRELPFTLSGSASAPSTDTGPHPGIPLIISQGSWVLEGMVNMVGESMGHKLWGHTISPMEGGPMCIEIL